MVRRNQFFAGLAVLLAATPGFGQTKAPAAQKKQDRPVTEEMLATFRQEITNAVRQQVLTEVQSQMQQQRMQMKMDLRNELKNELKQELRMELRQELRLELMQELRRP